ncbi:MAG: RNA polymerase sigma factor [Actinomycetota bacterium]
MTDHRHLALVKAAPAADTFEAWYRTHRASLRAMCARMLRDDALAEDIAQESLLRAWARRDQFADGVDVGPWLRTVARNLAIEVLRTRGRMVPSSDALPDHPDDTADPVLPLEMADERQAVRDALASLSERHQSLLVARDVEGVCYTELASREGLSEDATRAVLFRARRILRSRFLAASRAIGAVAVWLRVRGRNAADRLTAPALQSAVAALAPAAMGLVVAITIAAGGRQAPEAQGATVAPTAAVRAEAATTAGAVFAQAGAESAATAHSRGLTGVDASIDRRGGAAVRARARNPVTGEDEYVWTRVWREQGGGDSVVLSTVDDAAGLTCRESPQACETVDDLIDPSGGTP